MNNVFFAVRWFLIMTIFTLTAYAAFCSLIRPDFSPPGYSLSCDGSGHFCSFYEDNSFSGGGFVNDAVVFNSRQKTIDFQWRIHKEILRERSEKVQRPSYNFHKCSSK